MRKLIIMAMTASLAMSVPVFAEDADLASRMEALEERVTALETLLNAGKPSDPANVDVNGDLSIDGNGFSLTFISCETAKDYQGNDCVLLYFDFINHSSETRSAVEAFKVKIFQNGIEQQGYPMMSDSPQEYINRGADVKPGADAIRVAWLEPISDLSEIDVEISPTPNTDSEFLEFTIPLE